MFCENLSSAPSTPHGTKKHIEETSTTQASQEIRSVKDFQLIASDKGLQAPRICGCAMCILNIIHIGCPKPLPLYVVGLESLLEKNMVSRSLQKVLNDDDRSWNILSWSWNLEHPFINIKPPGAFSSRADKAAVCGQDIVS